MGKTSRQSDGAQQMLPDSVIEYSVKQGAGYASGLRGPRSPLGHLGILGHAFFIAPK